MALKYYLGCIKTHHTIILELIQAGSKESAEETLEAYCYENKIEFVDVTAKEPIRAKPKSSKPPWKENFHIYCKELAEAQDEMLKDEVWIKKLETFYPRIDIQKTIEKSIELFWGTQAGWMNKKKSKTTDIDWKGTISRTLNNNPVYKPWKNEETKRPANDGPRREYKEIRD